MGAKRRCVNGADVAKVGRVGAQTPSVSVTTTGGVSQQLSDQERGVINALAGGFNVCGEPTHRVALFLFCQASVIVLSLGAHGAGDWAILKAVQLLFD